MRPIFLTHTHYTKSKSTKQFARSCAGIIKFSMHSLTLLIQRAPPDDRPVFLFGQSLLLAIEVLPFALPKYSKVKLMAKANKTLNAWLHLILVFPFAGEGKKKGWAGLEIQYVKNQHFSLPNAISCQKLRLKLVFTIGEIFFLLRQVVNHFWRQQWGEKD